MCWSIFFVGDVYLFTIRKSTCHLTGTYSLLHMTVSKDSMWTWVWTQCEHVCLIAVYWSAWRRNACFLWKPDFVTKYVCKTKFHVISDEHHEAHSSKLLSVISSHLILWTSAIECFDNLQWFMKQAVWYCHKERDISVKWTAPFCTCRSKTALKKRKLTR